MGTSGGGVREFYAGRTVFITGATGYLGKVTLEKLLYSCPEINKLYLLVRAKSGKTAGDRLKELTSSPVFDRLRKQQPDFGRKIILIPGNIEDDGLGISETDVGVITADVSVVIHNAATIRFTEPLKKAVRINIVGLQQMILLAKQMKKLEAFVHVSTAYSNCVRQVINEQLYPQRMTPNQLIQTLSWMSDKEVKDLTHMFLQDYPNTYTFTKGLAELLLEEEKGDIPAAILRPSIIVSSLSDPVPGWIDGLTGANGLYALQGQGTLRKMKGFNSKIADLIPVDIVANASIVAGWKLAKDKPKQSLVVNMTSGQTKPILWGDMYTYGAEYQYNYPTKTVVRPPVYKMYTKYHWIRQLFKVIDHYIPAIIFDILSRISGQKPTYYRSVRGLWKFAGSVEYFTCRQWLFSNANAVALATDMSLIERRIFNCDVASVDWREFSKYWWLGTKQYVWREDPANQHVYDRRLARIVTRRRMVWFSWGIMLLVLLSRQTSSLTKAYSDPIWIKASLLLDKINKTAFLRT